MSKKLILTTLSTAAIAGGLGATFALNGVSAAKTTDFTEEIAVANTTETLGSSLVDETVYAFLNSDGSLRKTISSDWTKDSLGLDEYTKTEGKSETPIKINVSYTLDGEKVKAEDLAKKSGKVEIEYTYENTEKSGNLYVPYAVMTGLILENDHFKNIEVEGGKLLNDGDKTMIAGVSFPGLQENLGIRNMDFGLSNGLKITADATNFELGMSMSIATSEIFGDLDTNNFDGLNSLTSEVSKLEDGMNQLISGSTALYNGISELNEKSGALVDGIGKLSVGATKLNAGVKELSTGLNTLASKNDDIIASVNQAVVALRATAALPTTDQRSAMTMNSIAASLEANITYTEGAENLAAYLAGVKASADGAKLLETGASELESGVATLNANTPALKDGISKLQQGAGDLNTGLNAFNAQGISKLISAAGNLENFTNNLKSTINLAKAQKPIKYIYRVDEVK